MNTVSFDPTTHAVAVDRDTSAATPVIDKGDPPVPVNGYTFGVATMHESAPHGGEIHPDGDEVLYLISGRARVIMDNESGEIVEIAPGDGLIVPRGVWHRVEILEPSQIVYLTPGPNNRFRPVLDTG